MLKPIIPSPNVNNQRLLLHWWQLPFSFAMGVGAKVFFTCRLCGIYPSQVVKNSPVSRLGHPHWFNQTSFLCQSCHDSIAWDRSQFKVELLNKATISPNVLTTLPAKASVFYRYPYNVAIAKFKNQHDMMQLPLLAHAIRQMPPPQGCNYLNSVIIPVPTTPERFKRRGFDPVNMLARYLSFHWQIPLFIHVMREERQKQQGLNRAQRLANVENVFTFYHLPSVKRIILFDDVATTGATLQALAQSLINAIDNPEKYQIHVRALAHG